MRARIACRGPGLDVEGLEARFAAAESRALVRAGELVRARSAADAPRRSGALAASARVEPAAGKVTVRYGAAHAAIQHEHAEFHHPNGGRARFLRSVAEDPATAREAARILAQELGL